MAEIFDKTSSTWPSGTPDASSDYIAYADTSTGLMKRTTPQELVDAIIPSTTPDQALHFSDDDHTHVFHGYFWDRTKEYGRFFWEAWVNVEAGAEYVISDGYGGSHNLLFGVQMTGDRAVISGNVAMAGGTSSFISRDGFYANEWHHIAVGWDGNFLFTWVDGVLSNQQAASGARQTTGDISEGTLYIGGSSHSNFKGWIREVRGFEGWTPFIGAASGDMYFTPSTNFLPYWIGTGLGPFHNANFIADYRLQEPRQLDRSNGFSNGTRQVVTNTVVAPSGITSNGNARCVVTARDLPSSPVTMTIPLTTGAHTTATLIADAFRAALRNTGDYPPSPIADVFLVGGSGANITLTRQDPAENDPTMNFTIEDVTSAGITEDTTATITTPGNVGSLIKHDGFLSGTSAYPEYQNVTFEAPAYNGTVTATPVGALLFDAFQRANNTYAWGNTELSLGTAPTGQVWTTSADAGIIDASAFGPDNYRAVTSVGTPNVDVTIDRKDIRANVQVVLRYTDANNYMFHNSYLDNYHGVYQVVAGVQTTVCEATSFNEALTYRVVANGAAVDLYLGVTLIDSGTATLLTGNQVGFQGAPLSRVSRILVTAP